MSTRFGYEVGTDVCITMKIYAYRLCKKIYNAV